ncbi:Phage terminase large subunit (GpA) [Anatilimnocola aggregata]|uniref:Phage terminase large subunit (GpA) n=1 Tax=Anatilimnocola aggregata TaxID=2528021 RepID=A0A517YCU2_9BACT|nr:terminase gpA endonuclease subunit [Anatilimnocola aggregata]QDU28050.1 Phage terminase large subunit (GpA) [Anatilimnocola aggregata]
MVADPRKLRPGELCRLLNSTTLGEVISERQLLRHRNRAGLRIGDGQHVDLLRYVGWLVEQTHAPKPEFEVDPYEELKDRARARNAALSLAGRDIGELPEVVNPQRKARAQDDFQFFCEEYFHTTFHHPWSDDHLKVIRKIQKAVIEGGLFAMAMPRGSGKSSLCEVACIWALLFGHRQFVCLIGSDEGHAAEMLESIKTELEGNDLLLEDYPEVVYPIRALDGIANRCSGQLYQGERTHISWTAKEIVLPTMPASPASAAVIKVAGLTGRIRGMKHKRADGQTVRPSLVVLDDPQTDESARSLSQCAQRESILAGAVLGLAGPGQKISGIMPCTVIRPGDMADRILDRDKHPQWQGERTKMIYSFPTNEKLWEEYAQLRADGLRAELGLYNATAFYIEHQTEMDAGARIARPARFNEDEASAIQHAMNLRLQNEAAFFAEYHNEPLPEAVPFSTLLSAEDIAAKLNRMPRATVPSSCTQLTAYIDVQVNLLYYLVCAWTEDFSGYVIDYGSYPDQRRDYFTLRDANPTLLSVAPGTAQEGAIFAGLQGLTADLLGREWQQEGGGILRIGACLIDANWRASTDTVYEFCRRSTFGGVLMPSHGRYVGAASVPFAEYKRQPGERVGHNWRIPSTYGKRACRHVTYDTNYWKTFCFRPPCRGYGRPELSVDLRDGAQPAPVIV